MMKRNEFQAAFDALSFSPDFQERTKALLRERARSAEREDNMNGKRMKKRILTAAAACAALALSVSAAVLRLTPEQVARELHEPALAEAFAGADGQAQEAAVGEYTVVFEGMVSGERLSRTGFFRDGQGVDDRTWAVFAVSGKDGGPLPDDRQTLSDLDLTVTPLVRGYRPWEVNIWTLGGACEGFVRDGTAYFLLSMETLEQFDAGDVCFAVYTGHTPPSAETFSITEEGAFALLDGVEGVFFSLPDA